MKLTFVEALDKESILRDRELFLEEHPALKFLEQMCMALREDYVELKDVRSYRLKDFSSGVRELAYP